MEDYSGPQFQLYREPSGGQKLKDNGIKSQKEAAIKCRKKVMMKLQSRSSLWCELCYVTCTSANNYSEHIRGSKHCKVLRQLKKVGQPTTSTNPVVMSSTPPTPPTGLTKKLIADPKFTFDGVTQLIPATKTNEVIVNEPKNTSAKKDNNSGRPINAQAVVERDVAAFGHEYIEEVKDIHGKTIGIICNLCNCALDNQHNKYKHLMGKRHSYQYKKKIDPHLKMKPRIFQVYQRWKEQEAGRREDMRVNLDGRDHYDWTERPRLIPSRPCMPDAGPAMPMRCSDTFVGSIDANEAEPMRCSDTFVGSIDANEAELQAVLSTSYVTPADLPEPVMQNVANSQTSSQQQQSKVSSMVQSSSVPPGFDVELSPLVSLKSHSIPQLTSPSETTTTENANNECSICFEHEINSVLYKCGHICMCFECAMHIKGKDASCPICRQTILDVIKTYKA